MKTYLLDILNRYKNFSESLDVQTILCNKSWQVFNDSGEKELYIFQPNGSLIVSVNGKVVNATWQYIKANKSIIINASSSFMLHPRFLDDYIFALQQDGTNEYIFLIDENKKINFTPKSLSDLNCYFNQQLQYRIELEKKKEEEEKRRQIEYQRKREEEQRQIRLQEEYRRRKELEQERVRQIETQKNRIKSMAEESWKNNSSNILKSDPVLKKNKKDCNKFACLYMFLTCLDIGGFILNAFYIPDLYFNLFQFLLWVTIFALIALMIWANITGKRFERAKEYREEELRINFIESYIRNNNYVEE